MVATGRRTNAPALPHQSSIAPHRLLMGNRLTMRSRRNVLICEDEPLIAMDMEMVVQDAGGAVAGLASTSCEAMRLIENGAVDAVILDIELLDGSCSALARTLAAKRIPFVIVTGVRRPASPPPEFCFAPWLVKPVNPHEIAHELRRLLPRHQSEARLARSPDEQEWSG